jgi:hypothetical protein
MRIYISEESSRKLESIAERKGDSPENLLQETVASLDEDEAASPQDDVGANEVPKTG